MKRILLAVAVSLSLSSCIVRVPPPPHGVVVRPNVPCPGAVWIEGHYNSHGRWIHGHWRCPGVIVIED